MTSRAPEHLEGSNHMVVIQVSATARAEHAERFAHVLLEVVTEARGVTGCVRYDWFRSPAAEHEVFIYGEFESEDAFTRYRQGAVVRKIGEQLLPLLVTRPTFKHFLATVLDQS